MVCEFSDVSRFVESPCGLVEIKAYQIAVAVRLSAGQASASFSAVLDAGTNHNKDLAISDPMPNKCVHHYPVSFRLLDQLGSFTKEQKTC
jgi:hypothetical protein